MRRLAGYAERVGEHARRDRFAISYGCGSLSSLIQLADLLGKCSESEVPSRSDPARQLGVSSPLAQPARAHPKLHVG